MARGCDVQSDCELQALSDLEPAYQDAHDDLWDAYEHFERLTLRFAGALWCAAEQRRALEEALYDGAAAIRRVQQTLAAVPSASATALPQIAAPPAAAMPVGAAMAHEAFDAAG